MKSGSVEAFQVVVVCQETPPSCRIRRSVSRAVQPKRSLPRRLKIRASSVRDRSSVAAVWDAAEVAVFESVAVAFEGDDFGVVDEAVDHGGGDDVVAEDLAPAAEGLVAR